MEKGYKKREIELIGKQGCVVQLFIAVFFPSFSTYYFPLETRTGAKRAKKKKGSGRCRSREEVKKPDYAGTR